MARREHGSRQTQDTGGVADGSLPDQGDEDHPAEVLLLVDGVVWEGRVAWCADEELVAVVRPVGHERDFERRRWRLDQIDDMVRADVPEREDPLRRYAQQVAEAARGYSRRARPEP